MHLTSLRARVTATSGLLAIALTGSAFAQVAGDECSTAVTAVLGANAFDTTAATSSPNPPSDTLCSGTYLSWGTSNPDVWFKWTAPSAGLLTVSTCFAGSFDTSMALYSGTCASLTQVACNGDGTGESGCQPYYSRIADFAVTSGTTYYVRIGGYAGDVGTGSMSLGFVPAAGACATATASCTVVHSTGGCNLVSCCNTVCGIFPDCCDTAWDQTCVDLAVSQCGLYVYTCVPGGPANNCATAAQAVTADGGRAFSNIGATMDGPNHSAGTCSSGNDFFYNDVWFKVPAVANGALRVWTCGGSPFDSKLAIYDMGTTPASFDYNTLPTALVGCNDDGTNCLQTDAAQTPYASDLTVTASVGHTYLVRLGSYTDGDTGSGTIFFDVPEPCSLPSTNVAESEACGSATNNGCVNNVNQSQAIAIGNSVAGTFWADNNARDVDVYNFTLTAPKSITLKVFSASNVVTQLRLGDPCGSQLIGSLTGSCPAQGTWCLPAGSYSLYVATANFTGIPCGTGVFNNYVLQMTGADATCPSFGDTCTYNIASNVSQNTTQDIAVYTNGCTLWCGTSESTFSTAFNFARSFPGMNSGRLGCVSVGVSNDDVQADGTYAAGTPFTVTVGLYRDTNGGDPVGIGTDLQLITSKQFLVLGGYRMLTWNLDTPLDLAGNTSPIVVVLSAPVYGGCTAATNGVFHGVGNSTGSTASWFKQSIDPNNICNDAAFVAQTDQTKQWLVNLGMVGSNCPADLSHDNVVNGADLGILLGAWGTAAGDLNSDGTTNGADLGILLGAWGNCP